MPSKLRLNGLLVATVLGLAACDSLLDVELPGNITADDLNDPLLAETRVLSAIAQFECGFSEFTSADGDANADVWLRSTGFYGTIEYNPRPNTNLCRPSTTSYGWYVPWQMARAELEKSYAAISAWSDSEVQDREKLLAMSAVYLGIIYQNLGEYFCEMAVDLSPLMMPNQVLQQAETWFDRALQHFATTGDFGLAATESLEQLAYLGRARVRMGLGDLDGAADDAELVQPGFVAYVSREETVETRYNSVYYAHTAQSYYTVQDQITHEGELVRFTGYRDLTIDASGRSTVDGYPVSGTGVDDPRVPVDKVDRQKGARPVSDAYEQEKYTSLGDDQVMGDWAEAQLLLAEMEQGQSAVNRINAVRDLYELPHFSSTDAQEIEYTVLEEQRREFFLEGRFWSTKLRNDLWFPLGVGFTAHDFPWFEGTCLLMPQSEYDLNPNL